LALLQKEWIRTDKTYAQRVTNIRNGGGLNGSVKLDPTTTSNNQNPPDTAHGGGGSDVFFANLFNTPVKDKLDDLQAGETSVDI